MEGASDGIDGDESQYGGLALHRLRYFIVLAEELHFGRAAARLQMAQPLLSRSIKRLEEDLGVVLLDRSSKAVTLTEPGRAFYLEVRKAVGHLLLARKVARQMAGIGSNTLWLSYAKPALQHFVPQTMQSFCAANPDVKVSLQEGRSVLQIEGLLSGKFDAGLVLIPPALPEELAFRTLRRYGFVAAIPAQFPLARKASIRMKDLADLPFIMFERYPHPKLYDRFLEICREAGFSPRIVHEVPAPDTILSFVAKNLGVSVVLDIERTTPPVENVRLARIEDLPEDFYEDLVITWRKAHETKMVQALVRAFAQTALVVAKRH